MAKMNGVDHSNKPPKQVNSDETNFYRMVLCAKTPEELKAADLAQKIGNLVAAEIDKTPMSLSSLVVAIQAVASVMHIGFADASQDPQFLAGNVRLLQIIRNAGEITVEPRPGKKD